MTIDPKELTPVESVDGLYLKRDDLFQPFGVGDVNGGKLRQCYMLVESVKEKYSGLISCCSIHSPQAPITAAVAEHFGLPCTIFYGGTTPERVRCMEMPVLSLRHGAKIKIAAHTGRHNVLYKKARDYARENNLFVVEYGFNITQNPEVMFGSIGEQVQNIPDSVTDLFVTCGSGITTIGIIKGLQKRGKKNIRIHTVSTAPNREDLIYKYTGEKTINHDLFHRKDFVYEKGLSRSIGGIVLHPNYEAKTYDWMLGNSSGAEFDLTNHTSLLWIVGGKPEIKGI